MSRFLRQAVLFAVLQGAVFALLWHTARRAADSYILSLRDKHAHLAHSPSPRLILVGGSGLAFSMHSELLAAELPYAPANLGLHVGLGLDFILADAARDVRHGDAVALFLEYEIWPRWPASFELWEALLSRPGTALSLNLPRLADAGLGFFGHVASRTGKALTGHLRSTVPAIYNRSSFNAYGDMVAHRSLQPVRPMLDGDPHSPEPLGCDDLEQLPLLRRFVATCESRGARVFLFLPPIPRPLFELHRAELAAYASRLRAEFGDRVLGRLEDVPYPEEFFYDSTYHLTGEGGIRHTRAVIQRLKESARLAAPSFRSGEKP